MRTSEIKNEAKERFAVNRYHAMLAYGIIFAIGINFAVILGLSVMLASTTKLAFFPWMIFAYGLLLVFVLFLAMAPFSFGMTDFYLKSYRYEKVDAFHMFDGFNRNNLERVIILHLIKTGLTICFTILLIVPGIIYSLRTSMAIYLLRMNPKMKATEALRASNRIMKGHCTQYFLLVLSFVGWFFMSIATFLFGFIWTMPYFNVSKIVFYKRILAGDKTVYRKANDSNFSNDDDSSYAEDDDDNNIAVKLMKHQLENEILDMDTKIKFKTKVTNTAPNTKPQKAEDIPSSKPLEMQPDFVSTDQPKSMNQFVSDVVELIEAATPIVKTNIIEPLPKHIIKENEAVNDLVKQQTVRPSAAPTIAPQARSTFVQPQARQSAASQAEKQSVAQPTARQSATSQARKVPQPVARQSATEQVAKQTVTQPIARQAAPLRPQPQERPLVMPNKALPEVDNASKIEVSETGKASTSDIENIRERMDRIKGERARHNVSSSRIPKTRGSLNDEFSPEVINIEIDEDDK